MKNLTILFVLFVLMESCSTLRPASSISTTASTGYEQSSASSLKFINNVSITPGKDQEKPTLNSPVKKGYSIKPSVANATYTSFIENLPTLQFKYAILEDVPVEELRNERLLNFMDDWYGTKYRFGGTEKGGIDCSAFSSTLLSSVFGVNNLPRMARDQYQATIRISKDELQEGDLVFFHTYGVARRVRVKGKRHSKIIPAPLVTHVGVYLRNGKFIHASVSGVMISDLSEGYYASRYVGAGRAIDSNGNDAAMIN